MRRNRPSHAGWFLRQVRAVLTSVYLSESSRDKLSFTPRSVTDIPPLLSSLCKGTAGIETEASATPDLRFRTASRDDGILASCNFGLPSGSPFCVEKVRRCVETGQAMLAGFYASESCAHFCLPVRELSRQNIIHPPFGDRLFPPCGPVCARAQPALKRGPPRHRI